MDKVCNFCGTINDAHHSAACVDSAKRIRMRNAATAMYEALQKILAVKRTVDLNLFDIEAIHSIAEAALRAADGGE